MNKLSILLIFICISCNDSGSTISTVKPVLNCTVIQNATNTIITCPDGSVATVPNGTSVTPIQFCAGVVSNYPTTFPEVGFCIDNNIYAVYSTNGGFMTLIVPGYYNSNAVGSNCNFTVLLNCVISN